jgi:glycosyltransferase involved in cell wall biosynthesis
MDSVLVVIPAFNEATSVGSVVADARHHLPSADIVVVDDGSTDDTVAMARCSDAHVFVLPHNPGIGGAVHLGFESGQVSHPGLSAGGHGTMVGDEHCGAYGNSQTAVDVREP